MQSDALRGRTVLVTGGAGFIGSHLVDALPETTTVRILDDLSTGDPDRIPDGAALIEGDVRDRNVLATAMEGVDVVFHEAAMVSVPESVEKPRTCHAVNGTASLELLEAARAADARVVLASSAAVYGHPESVPVTEDAPKAPTSPYGVEKLLADQYARVYAERYDLPAVALRYFNVYGPGSNPEYSGVVDTFLAQARRGDPVTVEGDGDQTRDFVHVDDVVQANLLAAEGLLSDEDVAGRAYNVGTGSSVTIEELAHTVRSVVGADVPIVHTDPRPGDIERSRADISRARGELGYEPTVDLEEGLARD